MSHSSKLTIYQKRFHQTMVLLIVLMIAYVYAAIEILPSQEFAPSDSRTSHEVSLEKGDKSS
ncbi:MAG: hypothetical protein R3267_05620 [Paenisporosarcina sp.]|nr:hypothetical protein [Paenisporosarcina sp.]